MDEYQQIVGRPVPGGPCTPTELGASLALGCARNLLDTMGLDGNLLEGGPEVLRPEEVGPFLSKILGKHGVVIAEGDDLPTISAKCVRSELRAIRHESRQYT